jgi:pimeloyl-ACP methyl ester carboxylesterase
MRIAFADIEGIRTRYLYAGSGSPLVLLHGVGLAGDCFLRNIDALAERHMVVAPDLLGHGFTDAVDYRGGPPQPATVKHLCALCDQLGLPRVSIGRSSYGALIAALMWFARPQAVPNLILIGSGAVFHPADEQARTLRAAALNAEAAMGHPTIESCRKRLANICFDPGSVAEEMMLVQLTSYALAGRFDAYKATITGLIASVASDDLRVYGRLERLAARTLIVAGREDIRANWELHAEGRRRMPNARIVIMERCGHLPFMERAVEFNRLIAYFLEGREVGE